MPEIPHPLIDVLSADSFAAEHLSGAVNCCVYETAFMDHIAEHFPDRGATLAVYGFSDETREAAVAVEKLKAGGYPNVSILPGGLEGWKAGGGRTERGAEKSPASGRFEVDTAASFVRWTGRNLFNFHTGELKLSGGSLRVEDGKWTEGKFSVDMKSLSCSDLTEPAMNRMLIAHLRSGDFFEIDEYPVADFTMTSADFLEAVSAGLPNYRVRGDFTLRGVTGPLEMMALIAEKPEGGFVAQALLDLDRTRWGSIYGSGKFFARLGQHVVNDLLHLQLKIVTHAATVKEE